jgi:hypothetical protein
MGRIVWMSLLVGGIALGAGCSRRHGAEHASEQSAPEPPPPTPDTTPIPALRTPAGLVLGVEARPAPVSPSPQTTALAPTPAATPVR